MNSPEYDKSTPAPNSGLMTSPFTLSDLGRITLVEAWVDVINVCAIETDAEAIITSAINKSLVFFMFAKFYRFMASLTFLSLTLSLRNGSIQLSSFVAGLNFLYLAGKPVTVTVMILPSALVRTWNIGLMIKS